MPPNDRHLQMTRSENCRCFPRSDMFSRCFHFGVFEILVSSLFFWLFPLFLETLIFSIYNSGADSQEEDYDSRLCRLFLLAATLSLFSWYEVGVTCSHFIVCWTLRYTYINRNKNSANPTQNPTLSLYIADSPRVALCRIWSKNPTQTLHWTLHGN